MHRLAHLASAALAALLLPGITTAARASVTPVSVCYNYGCKVREDIVFDDAVFADLREMLRTAQDAATERYAISAAMARMYVEAGKQTPIWRDHAGDYNDNGDDGAMDCIDHAANVTTFLQLLASRGLLRYHTIGEPIRRGFLAEHWAGQIVDVATHTAYTVDSWFYEFGMPAIVMPLADWKNGQRPPGIMAGFR